MHGLLEIGIFTIREIIKKKWQMLSNIPCKSISNNFIFEGLISWWRKESLNYFAKLRKYYYSCKLKIEIEFIE